MKYCDYVNIKQGSDSTHRFSNGNTLPLCQLPFGMTAFAPQTAQNNLRWYYQPKSRSFDGIRLTHQPSPWIADYGAVCFMPQRKPLNITEDRRWSGFRPADAILKPYYLKYSLLRYFADIEITPTERCAVMRLTFKKDCGNFLSVLPVDGKYSYKFSAKKNTLYVTTDQNMGGDCKNFCEYLVIKFPQGSVDTDEIFTGRADTLKPGKSITGKDTGIHIGLNGDKTEIKIGVSYISFEQAQINLDREIGDKSFDEICAQGENIWEEYLSRVKIKPVDEKQFRTFCSCMYRAFLYPHKAYETDSQGNDIHYCPHTGSVKEGKRYTDNGFWDTYRTCYSFYSLCAKDELKDMISSFINEYRESGWLPRWLSIGERGCMPSTLIDAVICDCAKKGFISQKDLKTAFEGMKKHAEKEAEQDYFGRNGAKAYSKLGYVPCDRQRESVNLTLDAAYGDWCIAEIAKMLGDEKAEKKYRGRSKNYANLFDKETGFMRPKYSDERFREDFSPIGWGRDYTEGSAWQNSFAVPHDIEGLAELYGGKEKFLKKIDELFETAPEYEIIGYNAEIHEITEMAAADFGQCAISNQPSFHIPYIYSALGEAEKTAYWVKRICEEAFSYEDDGFPGDEDNGSMALWYIFSILGFYPFCPGKLEFVKGIKQVRSAEILGKKIDTESIEGNIIPYDYFI